MKMLRKMDESMGGEGGWSVNDHFLQPKITGKPTFSNIYFKIEPSKEFTKLLIPSKKMRISLLIFLCLFAIFPMANLLEEENAKLLMESLRKSLDGLETDRSKIRWDEQGFRVEEKNWQEKAEDWLNNIFEGKRRKRNVENQKNGNGEEGDSEELIRVNAKIVFYKNGTRMVDIQDGPLITVDPKGQISLDYRNGTMQKLGGGRGEVSEGISRNKRFSKLDDLYMANGFEFEQKDAADFGRDPWENGPNGGKLERAEDSSEEDDGKWQWARATEQKNPYWDKPLYAGMGSGQQQNDGNRPKANEIGGNQNQGQKQQQSSPTFQQQFQQQPAPPPKSTIWETIETPANGNGMASSGNVQNGGKFGSGIPSTNNVAVVANSQTNKQQQRIGGQSIQPTNFRQKPANPSLIQPPSPSPISWLQVQLMSEKPLSPEEIEFAKELMRQILEQEEKRKTVGGGGGANGQTSMIGQNGSGNGQQQIGGETTKQQQQGNVQQQPQQKPQNGLPKWAQPKGN